METDWSFSNYTDTELMLAESWIETELVWDLKKQNPGSLQTGSKSLGQKQTSNYEVKMKLSHVYWDGGTDT